MSKCIIVGCTSGYKSNPEKLHLFSVPKDPQLREKWQKCIPRQNFVLNNNSHVCEKHFNEGDIIKFWISGPIKVNNNNNNNLYYLYSQINSILDTI